MDWVDKLNRRALKAIGRQKAEKIELSSQGATVIYSKTSHLIRWSEIQEIAVVSQPQLADGSFALVVREGDSTITIVDDTASGYSLLCEELSRRLPTAVPYPKWATEGTANGKDPGQVIYRRPGNTRA